MACITNWGSLDKHHGLFIRLIWQKMFALPCTGTLEIRKSAVCEKAAARAAGNPLARRRRWRGAKVNALKVFA